MRILKELIPNIATYAGIYLFFFPPIWDRENFKKFFGFELPSVLDILLSPPARAAYGCILTYILYKGLADKISAARSDCDKSIASLRKGIAQMSKDASAPSPSVTYIGTQIITQNDGAAFTFNQVPGMKASL